MAKEKNEPVEVEVWRDVTSYNRAIIERMDALIESNTHLRETLNLTLEQLVLLNERLTTVISIGSLLRGLFSGRRKKDSI